MSYTDECIYVCHHNTTIYRGSTEPQKNRLFMLCIHINNIIPYCCVQISYKATFSYIYPIIFYSELIGCQLLTLSPCIFVFSSLLL